jgi:hypothetical protein
LLVFVAACDARDGATAVTRSDSAGILLVESGKASWQVEPWRLEGPTISIGSADGPEESQLHRVRAVARLSDGRIVLANSGSAELRVYGPDGRWLRSIGREGDGPGEFRLLRSFQLVAPDTLIAFDPSSSRVTVFTADGGLVSSKGVSAPGEAVQPPDHKLSDGRWLNIMPSTEVEGYQRRRNNFVAWTEGQGTVDTLLSRDGQEYLIYLRHQDGRYLGRGAVVVPFGGQDLSAIGPGRVALSDGLSYDVAVVELGGKEMRFRRTLGRRPLPDGAIARFVDNYVSGYQPARQPEVRRHFEQLPNAGLTPTHSALSFDRAGRLWAESYRFPWDSLSRRTWSVFNTTGEWLGDVEFPKALRVFEIGDDYVIGVERDSDGVEYVKLYRIAKPT